MSEAQTNATPIVLDPMRVAFAPDATVLQLGRTHFIGIGGAGMSVLAEMLHERGVDVDGSDREEGSKTERLRSLGITVEIGQQADNVRGADTVVYSSAIKPDNPEIVAAHERGIRIVHRSDILALLMNGAGRSPSPERMARPRQVRCYHTSSSMPEPEAGRSQLRHRRHHPGTRGAVLDGGHAGRGDVLVAEADESDGSFCKYRPSIAVITNALADHLDHYGDEAHYCAAFVDHAGHASGHVVMTGDDEGAVAVLRDLDPSVLVERSCTPPRMPTRSGTCAAPRWCASMPSMRAPTARGDLHRPCAGVARVGLRLWRRRSGVAGQPRHPRHAQRAQRDRGHPGRDVAGRDPEAAAQAASTFLGASRRFQVHGEENGVTVVDDYAHHPTEISALLDAARRRYPRSVIRVLFQPHLFSRTRTFAHEFAEALSKADDVIVTGIFPARELQRDFPDVSAMTIVDAAQDVPHASAQGDGTWISAVDDMQVAAQMLAMRCRPTDVVFTVGAGDITAMGAVILHALGGPGTISVTADGTAGRCLTWRCRS